MTQQLRLRKKIYGNEQVISMEPEFADYEKKLTLNTIDELGKKLENEVQSSEGVEQKLKDAEQREQALIKRASESDIKVAKMTEVVRFNQKVIEDLIRQKEQLISNYESELTQTKADRDANEHHLSSLEMTFSDLHEKYEKIKKMTFQLKKNEEVLVREKEQLSEYLHLQEQRYDKLKTHASQQLELANQTLETIRKERALELAALKLSLKKEETSRESLQKQLQQKTTENEELCKLIDELISGQAK